MLESKYGEVVKGVNPGRQRKEPLQACGGEINKLTTRETFPAGPCR
jgi:hypothetical protein